NQESKPAIAFDGANYFVAWSDSRFREYHDFYGFPQFRIFGGRLSLTGEILDPNGLLLSEHKTEGPRPEFGPAVAAMPGQFLSVWSERTANESVEVRGVLIPASGAPGKLANFDITSGENGYAPHATADANGYFVVWQRYVDFGSKIYGTRVFPDGRVETQNGF